MGEKDPNFEEEYNLDPEENLRLDNQIKKLSLELSGAKFMAPQLDGEQLPPDIESKMLDYIIEFNNIQKNSKMITIFQLLKNPKFKNLEDLTERELSVELEKIQKKLFKNGIALMAIKPVEERMMYEFLTGDFMNVEIHDTHLKGIVRQFIYEEFRPNEELNIDRAIYNFNQNLFSAETRDESQLKNYPIPLLQKVELFGMLYESFEIKDFEIKNYHIKKIKASVDFTMNMTAKLNDSLKTHDFIGDGYLILKKKKGEWHVADYTLPEKSK